MDCLPKRAGIRKYTSKHEKKYYNQKESNNEISGFLAWANKEIY